MGRLELSGAGTFTIQGSSIFCDTGFLVLIDRDIDSIHDGQMLRLHGLGKSADETTTQAGESRAVAKVYGCLGGGKKQRQQQRQQQTAALPAGKREPEEIPRVTEWPLHPEYLGDITLTDEVILNIETQLAGSGSLTLRVSCDARVQSKSDLLHHFELSCVLRGNSQVDLPWITGRSLITAAGHSRICGLHLARGGTLVAGDSAEINVSQAEMADITRRPLQQGSINCDSLTLPHHPYSHSS